MLNYRFIRKHRQRTFVYVALRPVYVLFSKLVTAREAVSRKTGALYRAHARRRRVEQTYILLETCIHTKLYSLVTSQSVAAVRCVRGAYVRRLCKIVHTK